MTDSQAPNPNTVRAATPGAFRRFLELLFMLFSAVLVVFSWDSAIKANEENAVLREELRRSKKADLDGDRSGTRCTVCLDNPREVMITNCGHVCMCAQCAERIRLGDNRCPVCRINIQSTRSVYIS